MFSQIAAAVSALPETAATGAKAKLGEREGKIENVTRLEVIKAEQAMIEEEEAEKTRDNLWNIYFSARLFLRFYFQNLLYHYLPYVEGNSRKGFGRCRLSCLLPCIH